MEILDDVKKENKQMIFSIISLILSLVTLGLIIFLISSMPKTIKAREGLQPFFPNLVFLIQIFVLSGIVMSGIAIFRREPSNWQKWLGIGLNGLFLLIIIGLIIFAQVLDYQN